MALAGCGLRAQAGEQGGCVGMDRAGMVKCTLSPEKK